MERGHEGAVVTDVVAGSPAESAGLKPGDVIVEVDRRPVSSSEEAVSALRTPQKNGHLLRVRGGGRDALRHGQVTQDPETMRPHHRAHPVSVLPSPL